MLNTYKYIIAQPSCGINNPILHFILKKIDGGNNNTWRLELDSLDYLRLWELRGYSEEPPLCDLVMLHLQTLTHMKWYVDRRENDISKPILFYTI